ncbi:dihydrofolate reductase family protein [Sinomicrobium soli]|uniref:dihydrofolate reductase family protein n=1 Tax=Sinomicrobium sp. N-1-3-6 TaxID=2219864 RepID=UPI000DCB4464|nr:dihydrofolate reductase family protein [Sinomicrobium sp. N-1-3-6]RAV29132.1 dihydrofolate reductase [Sinomicrobium sp. N-1-3-6]
MMRNLKLQMHISLDGYVTVEQGTTTFVWDNKVIKFCVENLENVDTILLGQYTAHEFIDFWDGVATNPEHPEFALGKRISETPKVVFSNTITQHQWNNTSIISGNVNEEINKLKAANGKDMLVYGGATLAASLIGNALVDEFYFLLSPLCFGKGLTIFQSVKDAMPLTLIKSHAFDCGTVLLHYKS